MESAPSQDPFAMLDSDNDEDDTNTGTFVSMEDYVVTHSLRDSQNLTNHSQQSSMAVVDSDIIDDGELFNNVAGSASNRTLQDTSAFVWDLGNPENEEKDNVAELRTPAQDIRSSMQSSFMKSLNQSGDIHQNIEGANQVSSDSTNTEIKLTPLVIRQQFDAIKSAEEANQSAEPEPTVSVSVSEAVTSFTIPNFFKLATPYTNIANPSSDDTSLILFSRTGPVRNEEIEALSNLATSNPSPLSRVVEMLAYTVEFQTHELTNLKYSEIDIASKSSDEQHRLFSEVDRRRSLCIRTLLEELDQKTAEIKKLKEQNYETTQKAETEKKFTSKFRSYCESLDSSIRFDSGMEKAFSSLHEFLHKSRRKSEATMTKQKMELEEYAERLLVLEKKLSDSQRHQENLRNENTSLKVKLASHGNKDCKHASLETPSIHCTNNTTTQIDHTVIVNTLSELREEHEEVNREKMNMQQKLLNLGLELENARRETKSFESKLCKAEAKINTLKEAHSNLEDSSKQVAKELTQNTINAVRDLELLRSELYDREQAISSYKIQKQHLEDQITSATQDTIRRGISIASEGISSTAEFIEKKNDKAITTLQREVESARELLNAQREEVEHAKHEISRLQNDNKLTMEELLFWKGQANTKLRETELQENSASAEMQHDTFLRRLSIKLNCHAENKRDLIRKLVQRIEELIAERAGSEAAKAKLNACIVEQEQKLHAIRSEYRADLSTLKCAIVQAENSRDRAISDRKAAEAKFEEIAKLDDTIDFTASLELTNGNSTFNPSATDNDFLEWNDQTIDGAIKSVVHLAGSKLHLASDNEALREKLNRILSGRFKDDDTTSFKELDGLMQALIKIIGTQQRTIRRHCRRVAFADGVPGMVQEEDVSVTLSHGLDETTFSFNNTQDFEGNMTDDRRESFSHSSVQKASSMASSFLRKQLEEARENYTVKMNDNSKLSTVLNDMEHKLEHAMSEKRVYEGQFSALNKLHEEFVSSLGNLLRVRSSTVVIDSCVRDLLKTISNLREKNTELDSSIVRHNTRILKLSAQKRIFEHFIGIYQRKYQLNILALPAPEQRDSGSRLRSVFRAVLASVRLNVLVRNHGPNHNTSEFIDLTSFYTLPAPLKIADSRLRYLPFTSAILAVQSNSKLQVALSEREQEIIELRQTLATLDTPIPSYKESNFSHAATFDYSQEVLDRKKEIADRLNKALQEKEELEVLLSHEKRHRADSEARANKYLEKASKLHAKLRTVKITAENQERTYKAAIRYLKMRADSAIDVDSENVEPAKPQTERSSSTSAFDVKTRPKHFAEVMFSQLSVAEDKLRTMESGTDEYKDQKLYINGLRSAVKRLRKVSTKEASTSSSRRQAATDDTSREEASAV